MDLKALQEAIMSRRTIGLFIGNYIGEKGAALEPAQLVKVLAQAGFLGYILNKTMSMVNFSGDYGRALELALAVVISEVLFSIVIDLFRERKVSISMDDLKTGLYQAVLVWVADAIKVTY